MMDSENVFLMLRPRKYPHHQYTVAVNDLKLCTVIPVHSMHEHLTSLPSRNSSFAPPFSILKGRLRKGSEASCMIYLGLHSIACTAVWYLSVKSR
jgi:hypothetical protein